MTFHTRLERFTRLSLAPVLFHQIPPISPSWHSQAIMRLSNKQIRKSALQYRDPAAEEERRKKRLQREEEMRKEIVQYQQNSKELEDQIDMDMEESYAMGYAKGQKDILSSQDVKLQKTFDHDKGTSTLEDLTVDVSVATEAGKTPETRRKWIVLGTTPHLTTSEVSVQTKSEFVEFGRTYKITNKQTKSALDLSMSEQTVSCRKDYGDANQRWTVLWRDGLCAFRCIQDGKYISTINGKPEKDVRLVGVEHKEYGWDLVRRRDKDGYQVYWKGTPFVWDHFNSGKRPDAILWPNKNGDNQFWSFEEV